MRYRQRYVDLIVNPGVRDTFEKRSAIVREIRNFMDSRGFMEVETPCLNTIRAARLPVRSSPITMRSTSICTCASRPSCILSA